MMQLKIPSEKDIREAYCKGEDAVVELFHEVLSCTDNLSNHIYKQQQVIEELKRQIAKNSSNSSKPPSSDGFRKQRTSSLRKKGEKTTGGQEGHKGVTLNQVETPDHKVGMKQPIVFIVKHLFVMSLCQNTKTVRFSTFPQFTLK